MLLPAPPPPMPSFPLLLFLLAYCLVVDPLGIMRSAFASSTFPFEWAFAGGGGGVLASSTPMTPPLPPPPPTTTTTTGSMDAMMSIFAPATTTLGPRDAKYLQRTVVLVGGRRGRIRSRRRSRRRDVVPSSSSSSSFACPPPDRRHADPIATTTCGTGGGNGDSVVVRRGGGGMTMGGRGRRGGGNAAIGDDIDDGCDDGDDLRRAICDLASIVNSTACDDERITTAFDPSSSSSSSSSSIVHIVGTGLNPTLMDLPLSTLLVLSRADVVLYDSLGLSEEEILRIVPRHCDAICVGKRGDRASSSWRQADIDDLLLEKACGSHMTTSTSTSRRRRRIVRLKGGDPFLFGRTRSEIDVLRSHRVPYTYTPGISSCIAGPHLGGIPLTDPSLDCQSFGVWSGTDAFGNSRGLMNNDGNGDDDDANVVANDVLGGGLPGVDVLVFLMIGRLDKLDALCGLIANNKCGDDDGVHAGRWSADTPCAVIQNAGGIISEVDDGESSSTTLPVQRVWRSTLGKIVSDIRGEDANRSSVSPAVFVVGATASLDLLSQDRE
jgi:siroheme synthase